MQISFYLKFSFDIIIFFPMGRVNVFLGSQEFPFSAELVA